MQQNPAVALLGSTMRLPLTMFTFGMDMLLRSMRTMQGDAPQPLPSAPAPITPAIQTRSAGVETIQDVSTPAGATTQPAYSQKKKENEKAMPDTDLQDDQAKWVRFSVWFMERGSERILDKGEDLVTKNFGADRYKVSKIFHFVRELPSAPDPRYPDRNVLYKNRVLRSDVSDLLDVRFEVVDRSDREELRHDEVQLERLQGIEDALSKIGNKILRDV